MPFLTFKDQAIAFHLRRSRKARRLSLVARAGQFEIVAPMRVSNFDVLRFLWEHRSWMYRQYKRATKAGSGLALETPRVWPEAFLAHESFPYRGERLQLQVKFGAMGHIEHQGKNLIVTVPWKKIGATDLSSTVKAWVVEWLKTQTQQLVQQTIEHHCPRLGRWPNGFQLKWQKTRWGSCGISQKIYINWILIAAPPGTLEYVVVHELCHLFYRNHGVRFWAKVEQCMPDYARYDKWLNKMGYQLKPSELKT